MNDNLSGLGVQSVNLWAGSKFHAHLAHACSLHPHSLPPKHIGKTKNNYYSMEGEVITAIYILQFKKKCEGNQWVQGLYNNLVKGNKNKKKELRWGSYNYKELHLHMQGESYTETH